jgi:hypothetical protein
MRLLPLLCRAVLAATAVLTGVGMQSAAAEECEGPFRQCALGVSAHCSRDRDGEQRMIFSDSQGRTLKFEQCVGRIYEARGIPNPIKTGEISSELPFPRIEILDPQRASP